MSAAVIEPRDIFLDTPATITAIRAAAKVLGQLIAMAAPIKVATPLPPLNLKITGYICPITTAANANIAPRLLNLPCAIVTATRPLSISITRVQAAALVPRTLSTFVVPALPLPAFLISIP